jgi:hypothetical protein
MTRIHHVYFDRLVNLCGCKIFLKKNMIEIKLMSKFSMGHCNAYIFNNIFIL